MTYDPATADRVRSILSSRPDVDVDEKRIIGGGLGFMVDGQLCCAATTRGLTVRVGPESRDDALAEPHVHPHLVGERQTAAFVIVDSDGFRDDSQLDHWVTRGLDFVATLR